MAGQNTQVSDAQLSELASRSEKLLKEWNSVERSPLVIEFAGSPKSGKSTTIDIITHFFKRIGFKVWAPTEGASKRTPYHLRRDLIAYNTWTLNYAISEMLTAYYSIDRHDLIILDRGPFDSLAWMMLLRDRGDLNGDEYEKIKAFATLPKWSAMISQIFLFTCEPTKSLEREHQAKLTRRPGTAMNTNMLSTLLDKYNALVKELSSYPVVKIDTSNTESPLATSFQIASQILDSFSHKLNAQEA